MSIVCGIYKITNKVSGRVYIGSSKNVGNRITQHKKLLDNRKHHNDDMLKEWERFGRDSFDFEIIDECLEKELLLRELQWCVHYDSMNPVNGFNKNKSIDVSKTEPPHLMFSSMREIGKLRGSCHKVLIALSLKMRRDNTLILHGLERKIIAEALKISPQTLSNIMSQLIKYGALVKIGGGEYSINENLIYWGKYQKLSARDIYAMLRYEPYQEKAA